jgi:hypothetical protein
MDSEQQDLSQMKFELTSFHSLFETFGKWQKRRLTSVSTAKKIYTEQSLYSFHGLLYSTLH